MILITVVDDRMGMCFNRRRLSRDRVLSDKILALTNEGEIFRSIPAMLYAIAYKVIPDHACSYPYGYTPVSYTHLTHFTQTDLSQHRLGIQREITV